MEKSPCHGATGEGKMIRQARRAAVNAEMPTCSMHARGLPVSVRIFVGASSFVQ